MPMRERVAMSGFPLTLLIYRRSEWMVSKVDTSTTVHLAPDHATCNHSTRNRPDPIIFFGKNSTQCTTQQSTCYCTFDTGIVIHTTHVGMCVFISRVIMRSRLRHKLWFFTGNSYLLFITSYITRILTSSWYIFSRYSLRKHFSSSAYPPRER